MMHNSAGSSVPKFIFGMYSAYSFSVLRRLSPLMLIASGCSVGLDYKTPDTKVPAHFGETASTQPSQSPNISHWWKSFNDPELNSLIARAVSGNNELLQAQTRVRQARAQLGVEIGTELPMLNANLGASRSQGSRTINPVSGVGSPQSLGSTLGGTNSAAISNAVASLTAPRSSELYKGGFDAGWEIDVFGGNRRAIESAAYNVEAQVDARQNVLVTLSAEVARDYVLLRGYQIQLELTKSNVASEERTLDLTRDRFGAGLVTELDVAQARSLVDATSAQEPLLEINMKQTVHAMSILLGEEPMALSAELSIPKPGPPIPSEIPVGLPSELLRRRPDVRQAERLLAASTANIGVAVANLFPKFSLTGSVAQQTGRLGLIARDASSVWSIGPTVSWQILDYNQLQNQVRVTNAQQQEALYFYQQTVLQSFGDVEDALVSYVQDQVRSKTLSDEADSNQKAVELSTQLYERGLGDFLNVQTAQRGLYNAQLDLAVSQSRVATDLVQLYKALGGGWDEADEREFSKFEDPSLPARFETQRSPAVIPPPPRILESTAKK